MLIPEQLQPHPVLSYPVSDAALGADYVDPTSLLPAAWSISQEKSMQQALYSSGLGPASILAAPAIVDPGSNRASIKDILHVYRTTLQDRMQLLQLLETLPLGPGVKVRVRHKHAALGSR
jgi:hypothetical protein